MHIQCLCRTAQAISPYFTHQGVARNDISSLTNQNAQEFKLLCCQRELFSCNVSTVCGYIDTDVLNDKIAICNLAATTCLLYTSDAADE